MSTVVSTAAAAAPASAGMVGRRAGRNVLVSVGVQLLSWALTFAVTFYLPRYVGADGLGKLTFALSFVALFGVVVPLGTSTVLVKEIARAPERLAELLAAAVLLRVPLALLAAAGAWGLTWLLGYDPVTRLLVLVMAGGVAFAVLNDAVASALQGREEMPRQSLAVLADKLLAAGLTILLIQMGAPLWALAAVGMVTGCVALGVNVLALRPLLNALPRPQVHPRTLQWLVVAGVPFMGWSVMRQLYGNTDPLVLSLLTNDATVGWYGAAFRLVGTGMFVPMAISTALLPALSRVHSRSVVEFQALTRRMLALILLVGVPVALLLILIPDQIIALLRYPESFRGSAPVLRWGGAAMLMYYIGAALSTALMAADGQKQMVRASAIACLVGIPLCVLFSWAGHRYYGNGAVGAMLSDTLLELVLVVCYFRALPAGTIDRESWGQLGRCVLAALPMALLLYVGLQNGFGAGAVLPVCGAVYVGLCWILRCVDPQAVAIVRGALARSGTN